MPVPEPIVALQRKPADSEPSGLYGDGSEFPNFTAELAALVRKAGAA